MASVDDRIHEMNSQSFEKVAHELCWGFVYESKGGIQGEDMHAVRAALEEAYRTGFAQGRAAGLSEASTSEGK